MTRDLMERIGKGDEKTSTDDEEHFRDVTGIAYAGKPTQSRSVIRFRSSMRIQLV